MARLPTVGDMGRRPVAQPQRNIASVGNAGAPGQAAAGAAEGAASAGRAVSSLGGVVSDVGDLIYEREATALAKERDTYVSEEIRKILYDPEAGFMGKQGRTAVSAYGDTMSALKRIEEEAARDLSPGAAKRFQPALERRLQAARGSVDRHTMGARNQWMAGASAARLEAAAYDAIYNPSESTSALEVIESEIEERARLEGWGPEQVALERDKAYLQISEELRKRGDALGALDFVEQNKGRLSEAAYGNQQRVLYPLAQQQRGTQLANAAFRGLPSHTHATQIEYRMGPKRPNAPEKPVLDVVGKSAQDVWGIGARIVVTSGQENEGEQFGSNRHRTGHAVDFQIIRPNGTRVKATDADMAEFARAAARNGALGVGFGMEYMAGATFHVDLVEPGEGQAHTWASGGRAMRDEIVEIIKSRGESAPNLAALQNEADPIARQAAFERWNDLQAERRANFEVQTAELGVRVSVGEATQAEIDYARNFGLITPSRWESLTEQRISVENARLKKDESIAWLADRIQRGEPINAFDSGHRAAVDDLEARVDLATEGDPQERTNQRIAVFQTTGVVPSGLVADIRQGMHQREPEAFEQALFILQENPNAFHAASNGSEIQEALEKFETYTAAGLDRTSAAQWAMPNREERRERAGVDADVSREMRDFTSETITDAIDSWLPLDQLDVAGPIEPQLMRDFEVLYRKARVEGMQEEDAVRHAARLLTDPTNGLYGRSEFASGRQVTDPILRITRDRVDAGLMRHPPEKYYPLVDGGFDYIRDDIAASLDGIEGYDASAGWTLLPDEVETDGFVKRARRGEQVYPGYKLAYFDDTGAPQFVYWRMDPSDLLDERSAEREQKLSDAAEKAEEIRQFEREQGRGSPASQERRLRKLRSGFFTFIGEDDAPLQ